MAYKRKKTAHTFFLDIPSEDELKDEKLLKKKYGGFIAIGGCKFKKRFSGADNGN